MHVNWGRVQGTLVLLTHMQGGEGGEGGEGGREGGRREGEKKGGRESGHIEVNVQSSLMY